MSEPWLRGSHRALHPALAGVLSSFEQTIEDLAVFTEGLSEEQTWAQVCGAPSVGFHIRHIAGSVDRLLTYASGAALTDEQLAELSRERDPAGSVDVLLRDLEMRFDEAGRALRQLPLSELEHERYVGRARLPTTLLGLLVHIAEHTQRHLGQAIVTAKVVRQLKPTS